ncbi:MAG: transcription-repair coupling factor [Clostridia bacterium]
MNGLVELLPKQEKYNELRSCILENSEKISVSGLTDSQKAHIISGLAKESKNPSIIICNNVLTAKRFIQDIKFFSDVETIYFPAREIAYFDVEAESKDIAKQRMFAINKMLSKAPCIIVTTVEAASQRMLPADTYEGINIEISINDEIDEDLLIRKFIKIGYTKSDLVEGPGQFAVRGGIIDVFPISSEMPYRVELFGDEIDSIRTFDKDTQRTVESVDNFSIIPMNEYIISEENLQNIVAAVQNEIESNISAKYNIPSINREIEYIQDGNISRCADKYSALIMKEKSNNIISFLDNPFVYIDEPEKCISRLDGIAKEQNETIRILAEKGCIIPKFAFTSMSFDEIKNNINEIYLEKLVIDKLLHKKRKIIEFAAKEIIYIRKSMDIHMREIKNWILEKKYILLVFPTKQLVEAAKNQLINNKINAKVIPSLDVKLKKAEVNIVQGIISSGFMYEDIGLVVLAQNVSGTESKKKDSKAFNGANSIDFSDLKVGEYVVHINHGIGQYLGVKTITAGGIKKDYICIKYQKGGTLYVPISSLDSIRKYACDEEKPPKLNVLGNKEWEKTKVKVSAAVKDIAKELIKLYAVRDQTKGYAFSKDTEWQKEFEDSFEHQITEDQERCTNEIKEDMEKARPMERLLCGDVGFGKTEVAMRAAFKAIMDGKQVAYLVPTTVLAMQQYKTFKDRMDSFGIKTQLLSRTRSPKQQKEILKELKEGKIDLIVGTHRLLSSDVIYKDLGFLIIDEEHRFGVKHKEKLKEYKKNIDILSMTATPIPRTLHMSIIGIRDMSVIAEPPSERLPVHTYVLEYDETTVKNAIENELEREGQVFYLYNKVQDIEDVTEKISQLVPDAKVVYAHGQMDPKQVEKIMMDFVERKTNVLVCTTILESGIDIQNANTIIVENADRLGLAQLYQIRGRVGRSSRLAYAYVTYRRNKSLTEEGEKRLRAIKDFTEFGSGHKIALRDLEIRGAGNVLGSQQHGHLLAVGYDLYCKMLELAVESEKRALSGEGESNQTIDSFINNEENEVKIDIDISAYIPSTYIASDIQKIEMYQKIADIKTNEDSLEIIDELIDRYGNLPKEVENLIRTVEIRNIAKKLKIKSIKQNGETLKIDNKLRYTLPPKVKGDVLLSIFSILKNIDAQKIS